MKFKPIDGPIVEIEINGKKFQLKKNEAEELYQRLYNLLGKRAVIWPNPIIEDYDYPYTRVIYTDDTHKSSQDDI